MYLSDTRLSTEGTCFSITKDSVLINSSTIIFISSEQIKIADQLTTLTSAKKASSMKFFQLSGMDQLMIMLNTTLILTFRVNDIMITNRGLDNSRFHNIV